jgi:glycosyltransferase involved in cell wall biosynthesis
MLTVNSLEKVFPLVIVDCVFFQLSQTTGIARVWRSLLAEWSKTGFAKHIIVLDRDGTAPKFPGIRYRDVHRHASICFHDAMPLQGDGQAGLDAENLQAICDEEAADLFISTYYTTPISTPSIFMGYDMVPEILKMNLSTPVWREKRHSILYASHYITISASTADDLASFFPYIEPEQVTVAHCGLESAFTPASSEEIDQFKAKFSIDKPYVLLVGHRLGTGGYKNSNLLFEALHQTDFKQELAVFCVGGQSELEKELQDLASGITTYVAHLSDMELRTAYSGAISLVYPSRYEGFGLPILEAMACGCPVITCRNSSIPEVAGNAAIYVHPDNPEELAIELRTVQNLSIREDLRTRGFAQAKRFSWANMAEKVAETIAQVAEDIKQGKPRQQDLIWLEFRRLQQQQQSTIAKLQQTQTELQQTQTELQQTQTELQQTQTELQQTQTELQQTRDMMVAMESSKFWKIRMAWVHIKIWLGLS